MSLFDALKPLTVKWTARYRRSPLPPFFAWWKAELVGCLPVRWQAWFQDRRETWFACIDEHELRFLREGTADPLARFALDREPDALRAELVSLIGREPHPDRRLLLAVPGSDVLARTLQFPIAVEPNLPQVLAFEMDRQTPFKADQVYFDFRAEPEAGGKQLRVDLALTPKSRLDELIERARALDLPLDGADVADDGQSPRRQGFNLLPDFARARRSNPQLRLNLILGAAAGLLLIMAMQQSIANREQALETLRAQVDATRVEARAVTALRTQLNTAVDGAGYLNQRKSQAPSVFRVLGDLSSRLPDETWLERMSFRAGGLEVAGQSDEATRLISLLQGSRVLSGPTFMGQITPDVRTRKERFTLSARYDLRAVTEEQPDVAGPEHASGEESSDDDAVRAQDSDTEAPAEAQPEEDNDATAASAG